MPNLYLPETVSSAALALFTVSKSYASVRALEDVTLIVRPGEVHGLIGQNGAGKSTLMGVASGAIVPEIGQVFITGQPVIGNPQQARQLGLAIVRQEPALMPDLTVAENLYLGVPKETRPQIWELGKWSDELLSQWKSNQKITGSARVNTLTSEQRFIVDIVRALAIKPKILILDEPTEHLQGPDVEQLFERIGNITANDTAVIYISHRIREVMRIADRATILRDGRGQGTYEINTLTERKIIELIVGSSVNVEFPKKRIIRNDSDPIFEVKDYDAPGVSGVSLKVYPGEILGLAGVDGNGQREFLRAIGGLNSGSGYINLHDHKIKLRHPDQAASAGIQYISNDRHAEGIFEDLSIRENFSLRSLRQNAKWGFVRARSENHQINMGLSELAVKYETQENPIRSLSGGNQQKVVIGSVLATDPKILLIDEPTQGVDIGSRLEIYKILNRVISDDRGAIILSSDAAELAGLCNRVMVFSRGAVAAEVSGESVTEENIISAILTSTNTRSNHIAETKRQSLRDRFAAALATDWAPVLMVAIVVLLLGSYTSVVNENYLSVRNFGGMFSLIATLALVGYGQQVLMLIGDIDLSVGALMGLIVVCQSFLLVEPLSGFGIIGAVIAIIGVSVLVGLLNWTLVVPMGLHPMAATLATFMGLQATSLMIRPVSDGIIAEQAMDAINFRVGFLPLTFIVAVVVAIMLDLVLFRRASGLAIRGFGSSAISAKMAGIPTIKTRLIAYLGCSLLAGCASISLLGQVGVGDPRAGIDYTLTSIAAVVIGGGSLYGARGSFVGVLLGAMLIGQVDVVTTFLELGEAWQAYLLGIMIIAAVAVHSKSRQLVLAK